MSGSPEGYATPAEAVAWLIKHFGKTPRQARRIVYAAYGSKDVSVVRRGATGELVEVAVEERLGELDFKSGRIKKAATRQGTIQ